MSKEQMNGASKNIEPKTMNKEYRTPNPAGREISNVEGK
jgi:hypothetical protein